MYLQSFYDPTTWSGTTDDVISKGIKAGRVFTDSKGYKWQIHKLHTTLTGTTVAGTVMYYQDIENWIVTDVLADAQTVAGKRVFAGVCVGTFTASGSTTATDKWILLLVEGIYDTVKTDAGNDIVEGDVLILSTSVQGGVDRLSLAAGCITDPGDAPSTADILREDLVDNVIPSIESLFATLEFAAVGYAVDDDVDATDVVKTYVRKRRV